MKDIESKQVESIAREHIDTNDIELAARARRRAAVSILDPAETTAQPEDTLMFELRVNAPMFVPRSANRTMVVPQVETVEELRGEIEEEDSGDLDDVFSDDLGEIKPRR